MFVNSNANITNSVEIRTGNNQEKKMDSDEGMICFSDVLASTTGKNTTDTMKSQIKQSVKQDDSVYSKKTDNTMETSRVAGNENEKLIHEKSAELDEKTTGMEEGKALDSENSAASEDVSDSELEKLSGAVADVLTLFMQYFGMSKDEMMSQLEALGMDMKELLTFDGIKNVFLEMKQMDTSDLLVDVGASQEYQSFLDQWNQILDETGILVDDLDVAVNVEDVLALLESAEESGVVQTDTTPVQGDNTNTDKYAQQVSSKEPEVIVENIEKKATSSEYNPEHTGEHTMNEENADIDGQVWEDGLLKISDDTTSEFVNPILQNIQDSLNGVDFVEQAEGNVEARQVVEQIVEQVRVSMNQDNTSMQLQLYPEHLGKIQIHIVSKDGAMTARIAAETEQAKQIIENGLANLKDAFEQQDLKVEAVEVMVSTAGFEKGDEQNNTSQEEKTNYKSSKLFVSEGNEDATEEDAAEVERMKVAGNSVSYMA